MKIVGEERLMDRMQTVGEGDYVKDGVLHYGANIRPVLVEDEDQLSELTADLFAPGSMAYLVGMTKAWQMGTDGTWALLFDRT